MITLSKQQISSNYSGLDRYDLVIIGAGITGLSTGILWLMNTEGKRTLIIDKNPYPGGYCTAYERKGYVFETTQLIPDILPILQYMGIGIPLRSFRGTLMKRLVVHEDRMDEYRIPMGKAPFADYLAERFPDEATRIRKLIDYSDTLMRQVGRIKSVPSLWEKLAVPLIAPAIVANLNRTFSGLMDKFRVKDPELREVMDSFASFSNIPSDQASAILTAGALLSAVKASHRPQGYFDELPAAMAERYQQLGGELLLGAKAEKFVVEKGAARGIKMENESEDIRAASVVTQFDPKRLPVITPIGHLYQPKFTHGLYGGVMNGVQVVDQLTGRRLNRGNSIFVPGSTIQSI